MVRIEWTEGAIRDLQKLDKVIARRILKKITWFSKNFERIILEALDGEFKGTYKLRAGDWRVVYLVERKTVIIQFVGHRREIYKSRKH
ncbi:MAG: type II toxin-antitoxin system RelE family toxin [Atribacterota bacterium]